MPQDPKDLAAFFDSIWSESKHAMLQSMYFKPKYFSGVLFGIALVALGSFLYGEYVEKKMAARLDAYTFSNTQSWDPLVYALKQSESSVVGAAAFSITLPPPPHNSSSETKAELDALHQFAKERTQSQIIEIQKEIHIDSADWGTQSYTNLLSDKPNTRALFARVLPEFNAVVITQKEYFDRVRASKLDDTLVPVITLPGHPAYPSGHASQSMLVALILGAFDPIHADQYNESALRIAHNREIAGVHYPSDSRAGQLLAREYFLLLNKSDTYREFFAEAQKEW